MRKFLSSLILVITAASISFAYPAPAPSKGQWAYFDSTLKLYRRASFDSGCSEVKNPEKWIKVSSVVNDDNKILWLKVKIDGQTGWLPQSGVLFKMGGKNKAAANLYKKYAREINQRGESPYFISENSEEDAEACREFFGTDIMGMSMSAIRKKVGTPTYRGSDYNYKDSPEDVTRNFLYYELNGYDMTLTIVFDCISGDREGTVISARLDRGGACDEEGNG